MEMEYKAAAFEVKELGEDGRISGYGAIYGNVDQGGDVLEMDAFKNCLAKIAAGGPRPKMLWQHDPSQPIGVWDTMSSDSRGLFLRGRILSDVSKGRETLALLRAKAIDGLSIGYKTIEQEYQETGRGTVRHIKEAELWETSVVTFPMNREATVTDVKQLGSPREVEQILRKAGVPGVFAKLVALHGFEEAQNRLKQDSRDGGERKAHEQGQFAALMAEIQGLKGMFHAQR